MTDELLEVRWFGYTSFQKEDCKTVAILLFAVMTLSVYFGDEKLDFVAHYKISGSPSSPSRSVRYNIAWFRGQRSIIDIQLPDQNERCRVQFWICRSDRLNGRVWVVAHREWSDQRAI
jgi:hypothetical protein